MGIEGHPADTAGGEVAPAEGRVESVASAIRQRRENRREANRLPTKAERLDEQRQLLTEAVADGVEAVREAGEPPVTIDPLAIEEAAPEAPEAPDEAVEAAPEPAAEPDALADILPIEPKAQEVPFAEWTQEQKLGWARENAERYDWAYNHVQPLAHDEFERDVATAMQVNPARALEMYTARFLQTQQIVGQYQQVQQAKESLRRASWDGFMHAIVNIAPDLGTCQLAVAEAALKPYAALFQGENWEPMLLGFKGNKPSWDLMVQKAADDLRNVIGAMTPAPAEKPVVKVKAQPIRDAAPADGSVPPGKLESLSHAIKQRRNIRRAQNARANSEG